MLRTRLWRTMFIPQLSCLHNFDLTEICHWEMICIGSEGTGTWPDTWIVMIKKIESSWSKKWGAIRGKKLHKNQEIVVVWTVEVVGVQLTTGPNFAVPETKQKRSKNVFAVISIAFIIVCNWPRLLQPAGCNAGRRTNFWDKKSSDFLERFFGRGISGEALLPIQFCSH